ncbi:Response regulator protein TmoT [Novipirellula aureliae]|uniref:Response regulator protein TmoT n=1 Tax=Novipirellula aureliae TaxID=2527966 RepID=A0A5C6DCT3_9BACT|nr:response regulator [Novipirellula aureliae]TWU33664.1 Response regulator protein TmoT [Novipirellula aureliae]
MTLPNPTVHVVDDDDSFRQSIVRLLRAAGYEVREHASAAEFLLSRASRAHGCVVLDIRMPGLNGLELQKGLNDFDNALPIVFLTGHGDIQMSVRAIKAGAVDFLTKPVKRDSLLSAVRNAISSDALNRVNDESLKLLRDRFGKLTEREVSVFLLVVDGKLNKNIASELGISERTVKSHRANLMEKLQVTSLAGLIASAVQLNLPIPKN